MEIPKGRRKLRRAISIAVDYEEFISIFANGRGIAAQSPIPPGIFGYRDGKEGINPYVYDWVDGAPKRKSVAEAKRLLAEAGYPDGVDAQTGQPLVIHLDTTSGGVGNKSRIDWMRKQFDKIGVQLDVRSTDYNRFQDKIRRGDTQMYYYGWNADYPDPENFLFLLDGQQAKVGKGGENASNYSNPEYDRLFEQMKNMENSPARQAIIDQMLEILRRDSPWLWGYHPKNYVLATQLVAQRQSQYHGQQQAQILARGCRQPRPVASRMEPTRALAAVAGRRGIVAVGLLDTACVKETRRCGVTR